LPYCPECGKKVSPKAEICPRCGVRIKPAIEEPKVRVVETKSPGVAAVLALVLGLFGLWGIGHIYVGKIGRGILLLVGGLIIEILALSTIFTSMFGFGFYVSPAIIGFAIIASVLVLVGWIWQTYDSYRLAKYFNAYVEREGRTPW